MEEVGVGLLGRVAVRVEDDLEYVLPALVVAADGQRRAVVAELARALAEDVPRVDVAGLAQAHVGAPVVDAVELARRLRRRRGLFRRRRRRGLLRRRRLLRRRLRGGPVEVRRFKRDGVLRDLERRERAGERVARAFSGARRPREPKHLDVLCFFCTFIKFLINTINNERKVFH